MVLTSSHLIVDDNHRLEFVIESTIAVTGARSMNLNLRKLIGRVFTLLLWVFFLVTWFLGRAWPVELYTHFYPQMLVGLLLLTAAGWWWGDRWTLLGLGLLTLVLLTYLAPFLLDLLLRETIGVTAAQTSDLSFVLFNTQSDVVPFKRLMGRLPYRGADVVFLLEVRPTFRDYLDDLRDTYPYQTRRERVDNFGVAVLSRHRITDWKVFDVAGGKVPWMEGDLRVNDRTVQFLLVHAFPPFAEHMFEGRNRQLAWLKKYMRERKSTDLVLGDLNVSPGSPYFGPFMEGHDYRHYVRGNPFYVTYGGWNPLFWTAIDHVFYRPGRIAPTRIELGGTTGSDHFPIYMEIDVKKK